MNHHNVFCVEESSGAERGSGRADRSTARGSPDVTVPEGDLDRRFLGSLGR